MKVPHGYTEEDLEMSNPYNTPYLDEGVPPMSKVPDGFDLSQFYGTEGYHRFNVLMPNMVLTDGAQYVAEQLGAFWLMDAIASYFGKYKSNEFAVAKLTVSDSKAQLVIEDGNDGELVKQDIEYTDFPLPEITLYVAPMDEKHWVIMLTSEY